MYNVKYLSAEVLLLKVMVRFMSGIKNMCHMRKKYKICCSLLTGNNNKNTVICVLQIGGHGGNN